MVGEILTAAEMEEGAGVKVRRLFPTRKRLNLDPFVLWDHFSIGPGAGFPSHPHRGFEAITYLFTGGMSHEDNLGNRSTVFAGGAQCFNAGSGLIHSEMPAGTGVTEGIQLWINLPRRLKAMKPAYQAVEATEIPEQRLAQGTLRVIVGARSPVRLQTPVRYIDVSLHSGQYEEQVTAGHRGLVYIAVGAVKIDGERLRAGDAYLVTDADHVCITAAEACRFLLCTGKPHGEPIQQRGPYVD